MRRAGYCFRQLYQSFLERYLFESRLQCSLFHMTVIAAAIFISYQESS